MQKGNFVIQWTWQKSYTIKKEEKDHVKKLFSVLLALCMVLALLPGTASAASGTPLPEGEYGADAGRGMILRPNEIADVPAASAAADVCIVSAAFRSGKTGAEITCYEPEASVYFAGYAFNGRLAAIESQPAIIGTHEYESQMGDEEILPIFI